MNSLTKISTVPEAIRERGVEGPLLEDGFFGGHSRNLATSPKGESLKKK